MKLAALRWRVEVALGSVAGALALITVAFTWNHQVLRNMGHCGPSGQCYAWVVTGTVPSFWGEFLVGSALVVCLGSIIDSIIDGLFGSSRVLPLVMVVSGALFCAFATLLAGAFGTLMGFALFNAQIPVFMLYLPTAVVSGVCALVALLPRQVFGG
jgi:hypothetical protein